ncbi:unnamed protein product [Rotaria sp. Silwood1]|nr:unnamed protein product [Rotaria sp. Silwood1]CAF1546598.1 unnamed protein product [Rotaria sp. Silwood1]CAF3811375.1 unnamed protein product [Rotaria sp. Silwood1]CAF4958825.1 unnamed protein product [Rotaria sp. Silwood1]
MNIYILRHGESKYNANPLDDIIDCPLTSLGIEQSTYLDKSSYPKHYSLIISSPLRRCLDTIKLSKINSDHFEINDLFREIYSGCKSDLLYDNEFISIENEQFIQERIKRINDYLYKKKELNISNILIVTHADLVWYLTSYEINGERFGTWLNNAQLFHWKQI